MTAVLLLLALVLAAAVPAAGAGDTRRLCARSNLYDTPNGVVIGRLYRPATVRVIRRNVNRRWANVRVRSGLTGWLLVSKLCRG